MTIQNVLNELLTAKNPVARKLHSGENCKAIIIGFKSGMILKEHQANAPSKLLVISGKVVYTQGEESTELNMFDEKEIPVKITHAVEALEDSICLLVQG